MVPTTYLSDVTPSSMNSTNVVISADLRTQYNV